MTLITFHDGSKQAYAYDSGTNALGRLSSITETDPAMQVTNQIAYAYDPHGRVTSETRTLGGQAYVTAYGYDSSGRMSGMTYPSGRTVTYAFDSLGRVSAVNTTPSGGSQQVVVQNVTYHPFGGVTGFTSGNSQAYTRSVDQDGRISSYTLGASSYGVGYDAASRIEFISETGNPPNTNTYGYDSLDRLTSAALPSVTYGYSYDGVGNRLTKSAGAGPDAYAYSPTSNRLASVTPASGPVRNFSFDANGSTLADGLNTYSYDTRGRMVQAVSSIGTTTYQVNALGQRVRKTNSLGDTVFTYDMRGRLVAETSSAGAVVREYIYLGDIPVAVAQPQLAFIHTDHLNTPRLVADAAGTTVWRWDQAEPFGANPANDDPDGNSVAFDLPLRLPGQRYDAESGLHYNYYRDYDPSLGTYKESDPIGLDGGLNTYAYGASDPLFVVDPLGLLTRPVPGGVRGPDAGASQGGACGVRRTRGGRSYPHTGVDLLHPAGGNVVSPIPGVIERSGREGVMVCGQDGRICCGGKDYAKLSCYRLVHVVPTVTRGAVTEGQTVATVMPQTNPNIPPHVHVELYETECDGNSPKLKRKCPPFR